jgi:hypothetical protein
MSVLRGSMLRVWVALTTGIAAEHVGQARQYEDAAARTADEQSQSPKPSPVSESAPPYAIAMFSLSALRTSVGQSLERRLLHSRQE